MSRLNSAAAEAPTSVRSKLLPVRHDGICIDFTNGGLEQTVRESQASSSSDGKLIATPDGMPATVRLAKVTSGENTYPHDKETQIARSPLTATLEGQARLSIRLPDGDELVVGPVAVRVISRPDEAGGLTGLYYHANAEGTAYRRRHLVLGAEVLLYIGLLALGFTAIATAIWLETFDNTTLWQTMKDQSVRLQSVATWLAFWVVGSRLLFLQWRWLSQLKVTAIAVLVYGLARLSLQYLSALVGTEPPPYTAFLGLLGVIFVSACFHIYTLPITRLQFQSLVIAAFIATAVYGVSSKNRAEWERSAIGDIPQQLPIGWDFQPHETHAELTRQLKNLRERADAALTEPAKP
jgi:hypothetical protein